MPINTTRLQTKLNAVRAKDANALAANRVYIPYLGDSYTAGQLAAWLKKRTDLLEDVQAKNYTDQQINNLITSLYNSLSQSDKVIADQIRNGQPYELTPSTADAYDKLVSIILYKFVTTP